MNMAIRTCVTLVTSPTSITLTVVWCDAVSMDAASWTDTYINLFQVIATAKTKGLV